MNRIRLLNVPANTPKHFLDPDGGLSLDFCPKFERSKKVDQVSLERISSEGVLGFFIVNNDKNTWCITNAIEAEKGLGTKGFYVQAWHENIILPQVFLRIYNRTRRGREAELVMPNDFWAVAIKRLRVCDVDLPNFLLTEANLRNNWANNALYNDGDAGLWFPLVHYGNWATPASYDDETLQSMGKADESDFRPWIHVLALLQRGFCKLGYKFRSPILETPLGRSLIAYLLADLSGNNSLESFKVAAYQTDSYLNIGAGYPPGLPGNPLWLARTNELQFIDTSILGVDAGFYIANSAGDIRADGGFNYYYLRGLSGKYSFDIEFDLDTLDYGDTVILMVSMSIYDPAISPVSLVGSLSAPQFIVVGDSRRFRWNTGELDIDPKWRITFSTFVFFNSGGSGVGIYRISNGFIKANPISVKFQANMQFVMKAWLDCSLKFEELLRGVIHLVQGKLVSDELTRTVWLYQSDPATMIDGQQPEAFYQSAAIEAEYDCTSYKFTYRRIVDKRHYILGYKSPDDEYVKQRGFDNDSPVKARRLDFGERYEKDTERNLNPFFEATENILAKDLQHTNIINPSIDTSVELPACWDSTEYKIAKKVKPRILIAKGLQTQYRGKYASGNDIVAEWGFKTSIETELPMAYMYTNQALGTSHDALVPLDNIAYDFNAYDLSRTYWRGFLAELASNEEFDIQLIVNPIDFDTINMRRFFNIKVSNTYMVARLLTLERFTGTKAEATFRPQNEIYALCDPIYNCSNVANFELTRDADCIIATRTAGITSPATTDKLYYRKAGSALWLEYTEPLCGCDVREFLDFSYECSATTITITNASDCGDILGSVHLLDATGALITMFPDVVSTINFSTSVVATEGSIFVHVVRTTAAGIVEKSIKLIYIGGSGSECSRILLMSDASRTNQYALYPYEFRREVTFSDGCPQVSKTAFI